LIKLALHQLLYQLSTNIPILNLLITGMVLFVLSVLLSVVSGSNVDQDVSRGLRRSAKPPPKLRHEDLQSAVAAVLGEGHDIHHGHLEEIAKSITPMWLSLPKIEHNRVDRRSLRYAVHRYFMQIYSLSIVGLEPVQVNGQHDEALLLTQLAPAYVRDQLEGKGSQAGFSLDDAVVMIATLERLVEDTTHGILERSYAATGRLPTQKVGTRMAKRLVDAYILRWMLGEDAQGINEMEGNGTLMTESLEDWPAISVFGAGELKALQFARRTPARSLSPQAWNDFEPRFTFRDVESVVKSVTMSFGNFWTTECQRVKGLLVDMDHSSTGRVKLSDFYGAALAGEWRFSESKEYLRQLGALDESSSWQGARVIITNYMQASSNCIVSAQHYRVCCANECEGILGEVEAAVQSPLATPDAILMALVNHSSPLDDNIVKLSSSMKSQLHSIAKTSPGGMVPVHGRLFAQWLHYAFPRECAFPYKAGETVALSPSEFGEYAATEEDMTDIVSGAVDAAKIVRPSTTEDDEMSQWSHEEELLSDSVHLHAPWEAAISASTICFLLVVAGAFAAHKSASHMGQGDILPTSSKVHSF